MSRIFSVSELLNNLNVIDHFCPENICIEGGNINSELIKPGNIFFAIRGKKVDGHDFVKNAFDNGAQLCIIDHLTQEIIGNKYPFILVDDVLKNLFILAKYCRQTIEGKVIALTGSAGKSTTKNWLFEVLQKYGKTYATYANQNTDIGSALTLINCEKDIEFCVMELGMSTRGEISTSSKLIEPDIALITNVKPVHIENFHSLLDIAHEKADIVDGMRRNGTLFINCDETPLENIVQYVNSKGKQLKIYTFGKGKKCDCLVKSFFLRGNNFYVSASMFGNEIEFKLQNVGEQFIRNVVAILGVIRSLDLDIQKIIPSLLDLHLYPGAGGDVEVKIRGGRIKIIDETYNANPNSVICAIKKLSSLQGKRKILVLGDMYELGDYEQKGMDDILECILQSDINLIFTCGEKIKYLFDKLPMQLRGGHCDKVEPQILDGVAKDGDIFLIKGSHGVDFKKGRMYEFVKKLISYSI